MKARILVFIFIVIPLLLVGGEQAQMRLTMEKAVQLALKNNKNYLISREEVKQYKYRLRQNWNFLPDITLEGFKNLDEKLMELEMPEAYPGAPPQTVTIDFTKNYEFTLQVVQPVFAGGKILFSYKNAKLDLVLAGEKQENTRRDVILQVKKGFLNILVLQELLKAHNEALQLAETTYRNVNENFNLGMASKYDLLRAELAVASIKPNLLNVEKLLRLAMLNLKLMTGIPADTEINIEGELDYTRHSLDLAELVQKSQANRFELHQLETEMKKTSNLLLMAYGRFLPDISLVAAYSYRSDFFRFGKDVWEDYYTINLAVNFPIFNQNKRSAQIGELKVMKKILALNYDRLKDATKLEIEKLYLTLREEYQNIQAGHKNVETAKEGVRIAKLNYNEGLISILELNASLNELTKARVAFFQAVYNYNIAAAEIEKIAGIKINGGPE